MKLLSVNMKNEHGVSVVIVMVFILMISLLAAGLVSMVVVDTHAGINRMEAGQAHFIAESGLEVGLVHLIRKNCAAQPCRCADITGAAGFTGIPFGEGEFTVTGTMYHSRNLDPGVIPQVATLSGDITADPAVETVNAANANGYAAYGRCWLGSEADDYTAISGGVQFANVNRGTDSTSPAAQSAGLAVLQNQCNLVSAAEVRNGRRTSAAAVAMQDGWIVGEKKEEGALEGFSLLLRYQDNDWVDYSVQGVEDADLNDVFMTSAADVWAAGKANGKGIVLKFNGISWSTSASGLTKGLKSIYMTDADNNGLAETGWAVGENNGFIAQYSGGAWNNLDCDENPTSKKLLQVVMTSSTDGWVLVDDKDDPFLRYSATGCAWQTFSGATPNNNAGGENTKMKAVSFVSASDGWAVGNDGSIWRFTGGTDWTAHASSEVATDEDLTAIFMLDTNADGTADDGFAAGKNGAIIRYTPNLWNAVDASAMEEDATKIFMASPIEAWMTGENMMLLYWNGIEWTQLATPAIIGPDDETLQSISIITPARRIIDWREVF